MTQRASRLTLPVLLTASVALLLAPLPSMRGLPWHALRDAIENLGHPVVFALLAWVTQRYLRSYAPSSGKSRWMATLAMCLALGATTEWVQSLTGRDGSWSDLLGDTLGALAGLGAEIGIARRKAGASGWRVRGPCVGGLLSAAAALTPLLLTAAAYVQRAIAAPEFWRNDSYLLRQFSHFEGGRYPGLVMDEPPPDWSAYEYLAIDVVNNTARPVTLHLRVHDAAHDDTFDDRFHGAYVVQPGENRIQVSLEQVRVAPRGRRMRMEAIRGMAVFVIRPDVFAALHIKSLSLGRTSQRQ